jgi:hypothetical protein
MASTFSPDLEAVFVPPQSMKTPGRKPKPTVIKEAIACYQDVERKICHS